MKPKLIIFGISLLVIAGILYAFYLQDDEPKKLIEKQYSFTEKIVPDDSDIIPEEKIIIKPEKTEFDIKKEKILNSLTQMGHSSFSIKFDEDKSSDGNKFHVYKVVHNSDGYIGDVSFYYGKSSSFWHPSEFENIFQLKIFLSNENGSTPTSASKPFIKDILEEFGNEMSFLGITDSSEWIESSIISGKDVGGGERKETLSGENLEISFASKRTSFGFYELIITEKID